MGSLCLPHRIEKEIEDLEAQELDISANEEVVLKRLKEVERTPEDIIKVGSRKLSPLNFIFFTLPPPSVLLLLIATALISPFVINNPFSKSPCLLAALSERGMKSTAD